MILTELLIENITEKEIARVFDVDGVILDIEPLLAYISKIEKKYSHGWWNLKNDCLLNSLLVKINPEIRKLIDLYHQLGEKIIILTGRPFEHVEWLEKFFTYHGIWFDKIIARPSEFEEGARDHDFKKIVLEGLLQDFYIFGFYDDSIRNCLIASQLGIKSTLWGKPWDFILLLRDRYRILQDVFYMMKIIDIAGRGV